MGLDLTHGCWSGSYSAFTRFRFELWRAAGGKFVHDAEGFRDIPDIWLHDFPAGTEMGEWEGHDLPSDPLVYLIQHVDCGGALPAFCLMALANRIEELLPNLTGDGGGHIARDGGFRKVAERFIAGLRAAAAEGECVEFR